MRPTHDPVRPSGSNVCPARSVTARHGKTPAEVSKGSITRRADLACFRWETHCRGLYPLPMAACVSIRHAQVIRSEEVRAYEEEDARRVQLSADLVMDLFTRPDSPVVPSAEDSRFNWTGASPMSAENSTSDTDRRTSSSVLVMAVSPS